MRPGNGKILSILLIFAGTWLLARFFLPLFGPFLLGTLLALAAEPMVRFLNRRVRLPRSAAAGIAVTMTFGFLGLILLILGAFLLRELRLLTGMLPQVEEAARSGIGMTRQWLLGLSAKAPVGIRGSLEGNVEAFFSDSSTFISRFAAWLLSLAGTILSHIPDSALGLFTAVVSGYMISAKLPKLRHWCLRRIPKRRRVAIAAALKRIRSALGAWFLAQGKLMGLTFVILLLGFVLLRIPHALVWALVICLVDAFPVLGTGTVLLPWSLLLFLLEDPPRAIGMLGIYATITLSRSIAEPKLLGRHLGLDPLAALMALYAGFQLWGITGMLLAPVLTAIAVQLIPEQTDNL